MADRTCLHARLEAFLQLVLSRVHAEGLHQLVELDLSLTQARTLFAVAGADRPLAINEIASSIGLSLAATGRSVDSLVRLGTLERRENPDDRRVKLVAVTERGFEIADEHLEHKRRALRATVDLLDPTTAADLDRVLGTILEGDALREHQEAPHD